MIDRKCSRLSAKWLQLDVSLMHEVTRRIMNRPALSKAAESERVMASEVAEGLEERIVGVVAPVLRPRVRLLYKALVLQ